MTHTRLPDSSLPRDAVWVVGGVEQDKPSAVFMEIVQQITVPVLTELLGRMIQPGSVLVTDGFSLNLSGAASLHLKHQIVVHSREVGVN